MIRTGWFATAVLALAPLPCFGQFGGMGGSMPIRAQAPSPPALAVKVGMAGDKSLVGQLRVASVSITCDLGFYELRAEKIREVRFDEEQPEPLIKDMRGARVEGTIVTSSGEEFHGTVYVPDWKVETALGTLTPDPQKLKSLSFTANANAEKVQNKD